MGCSRGGLTTKIHALVDAAGLPLALKLTEGQAHDGRSARDMLGALMEGQTLLAGRAYDSDELRKSLDERGAWANIKPMPNRKNVPAFSSYLYRYRNLVERFFNKIKHYRAVARATTKRPITSSPASNSLPLESGCAFMSRWSKPRSLRGTPCAKRGARAAAEAPDLMGVRSGLRLVDSREWASHNAAPSLATRRLPVIAV